MAQSDPCYLENVNFAKYLLSLVDSQELHIYDLGHQGKTLIIDDEPNRASLLHLTLECDCSASVIADVLIVVCP